MCSSDLLARLADELARHTGTPLDALLDKVLADVRDHCKSAPMGDDVCVVAVEIGVDGSFASAET